MNLAQWLAGAPESAAKAGPGKELSEAGPGSRAQPLSYVALLAERRERLDQPHG